MDHYVLEYIKQRMRELSFEDYTFQAIRIKPTGLSTFINAQNEYYYLVAKEIPSSVLITSDTNIWNESDDYEDFNFYGIQEFTGQIKIAATVPIDLEFIRVVPKPKLSESICLYLKEVQLIETIKN
ncbi:MAG: hypothetical protein ACT4ON_13515 [Bacteroidota bacterium]